MKTKKVKNTYILSRTTRPSSIQLRLEGDLPEVLERARNSGFFIDGDLAVNIEHVETIKQTTKNGDEYFEAP